MPCAASVSEVVWVTLPALPVRVTGVHAAELEGDAAPAGRHGRGRWPWRSGSGPRPGVGPVPGFEVGELTGRGVGGEGWEAPTVVVGEAQLRTGVGPFAAD